LASGRQSRPRPVGEVVGRQETIPGSSCGLGKELRGLFVETPCSLAELLVDAGSRARSHRSWDETMSLDAVDSAPRSRSEVAADRKIASRA
jgi:hypothetical protein